jgi:hypothetical protein
MKLLPVTGIVLLTFAAATASLGLHVDEGAAGFSFTVNDNFTRSVHPNKKRAPDTYFDLYASKEHGLGIGGQAYRVKNWDMVVERAIDKVRSEFAFQFTSDPVLLSDKTESGELVSVYYARTDNPNVPLFMFYSFKTEPHTWIVYFVIGRSGELSDYLTFAKKIYSTVRVEPQPR